MVEASATIEDTGSSNSLTNIAVSFGSPTCTPSHARVSTSAASDVYKIQALVCLAERRLSDASVGSLTLYNTNVSHAKIKQGWPRIIRIL